MRLCRARRRKVARRCVVVVVQRGRLGPRAAAVLSALVGLAVGVVARRRLVECEVVLGDAGLAVAFAFGVGY